MTQLIDLRKMAPQNSASHTEGHSCEICGRPFTFPEGQFTWHCKCGLIIQRYLTKREREKSASCQLCGGSGDLPYIFSPPPPADTRPHIGWGLPCPGCPAGGQKIFAMRESGKGEVHATSQEMLPDWEGYDRARQNNPALRYWRYVCDKYDDWWVAHTKARFRQHELFRR